MAHWCVRAWFQVDDGTLTSEQAQAAVDAAMEQVALPPGITFQGPTEADRRRFTGERSIAQDEAVAARRKQA